VISISEDSSAIYFLLEKLDIRIVDFSIDHTLAVDVEDDFLVIFYLSAETKFISFTAVSSLQDKNVLPDLLSKIQDFNKLSKGLQSKGVRMVEDKIHSKNNSQFYFDAH
jgi:hypothetical protein